MDIKSWDDMFGEKREDKNENNVPVMKSDTSPENDEYIFPFSNIICLQGPMVTTFLLACLKGMYDASAKYEEQVQCHSIKGETGKIIIATETIYQAFDEYFWFDGTTLVLDHVVEHPSYFCFAASHDGLFLPCRLYFKNSQKILTFIEGTENYIKEVGLF